MHQATPTPPQSIAPVTAPPTSHRPRRPRKVRRGSHQNIVIGEESASNECRSSRAPASRYNLLISLREPHIRRHGCHHFTVSRCEHAGTVE